MGSVTIAKFAALSLAFGVCLREVARLKRRRFWRLPRL